RSAVLQGSPGADRGTGYGRRSLRRTVRRSGTCQNGPSKGRTACKFSGCADLNPSERAFPDRTIPVEQTAARIRALTGRIQNGIDRFPHRQKRPEKGAQEHISGENRV